MIKIKFGEYTIDATGHAEAAPVGEDMICMGVSTVLWALMDGLAQLEGVESMATDLRPGNGHVEAHNVPPQGDGMFVMAEAALVHLATTFPDQIQIVK